MGSHNAAGTVAGILLCLGLAGCSGSGSPQDVMAMYEEREHAVSRVAVERSLADLLPNRHFSIEGAAPEPLTAGVAIGVITDVAPGRAYVIEGDDAPGGTEVDFNDPKALWRTVDVTLELDKAHGNSLGRVSTVRFGLPVSGGEDVEAISAGLEEMGRVIVVLDEPGAFEYDPALHPVHWDGVFLAPVDEAGSFRFSALGEDAATFQGGLDTLVELDRAAAAATVKIATDQLGVTRATP